MRHITIILTLLSTQSFAFEISNFKSGLACTDGVSFAWICHELEDIYVSGQSSCTFNKEKIPCTWHGFSFDYKNYDKSKKINCQLTSSKQIQLGNPEGKRDQKASVSTYDFELKDENGYFINPQYVGLSQVDIQNSIQSSHTSCSYDGKEVFEFSKQFHFPLKNN